MNFIWHKGMSYSAAGIHDSWSSRDVCEPGLCHLPLLYIVMCLVLATCCHGYNCTLRCCTSLVCILWVQTLQVHSRYSVVSVPDPKPIPARIAFSILQAIHTLGLSFDTSLVLKVFLPVACSSGVGHYYLSSHLY